MEAAQFIVDEMMAGGQATAAERGPRLLHSWKDGRVSGDAFLDDHACVAEGFLALYRCTFEERWFTAARSLVDELLVRFARPDGGFFDTSSDHETLITRPRAAYDSPTPTGHLHGRDRPPEDGGIHRARLDTAIGPRKPWRRWPVWPQRPR